MTEADRKSLREQYQKEYEGITGKKMVCIETKTRLSHYAGVARKHLIDIAAQHSGLTVKQLQGDVRKREYVAVRQMVCCVLKQMHLTSTEIARMFNKDHTSILFAIDTVQQRMSVDKDYNEEYHEFRRYCVEHLEPYRRKREKIDEHQRKAIQDSLKKGGISENELAEIYNVDRATINRIKNNKKRRK